MTTKIKPMTEKEIQALSKLIEYTLQAETRHYEECTPEEQDTHIYKEAIALNEYLESIGRGVAMETEGDYCDNPTCLKKGCRKTH